MQDHYWSGLDEYENKISGVPRQNEWAQLISYRPKGNTICFTKENGENITCPKPTVPHKFSQGINKNKPTVFAHRKQIRLT
jgi:hypothetical protein